MSNKYSAKYDEVAKSYDKALDDLLKASVNRYDKAQQAAQQEYGKYAGEEGYHKSVQLGQETARQIAGSAASQAQARATAAARAAGMTSSQAALLGAQQAAGAYGNVLNNQLTAQQQAAYGAGMDRAQGLTGAGYQTAQGVSGAYGDYATGKGNLTGSYQQQQQNKYNQNWNTANQAIGLGGQVVGGIIKGLGIGSDERIKNYVPTEEMVKYLQTHGYSKGRGTSEFDPTQLAIGILVEQEHGKNFAIALEIAKDHLVEDPMYYTNHNLTSEAVDRIEVDASHFKIDTSKLKEI